MESKRTQASRTAATRAALVAAARPLFAERGYAGVGTDELARAAGVTRGALYHQFDGKLELFEAVFEAVEADLMERIDIAFLGGIEAGGELDPVAATHRGIEGWLVACEDPVTRRIALIEAPAVLGWEKWREIGRRYGVGLVESALQLLLDGGLIADQPVRPLAHILVGALEEAALYAAAAEDQEQARSDVLAGLTRLVDGLLTR